MTQDLQKHMKHLCDLDLSTEAKMQVLRQLRTVAEGFADYAWGVHPTQQIPCGQVEENSPKSLLTAPFELKYFHGLIANEFEKAAGDSRNARRKNDNENIDENE